MTRYTCVGCGADAPHAIKTCDCSTRVVKNHDTGKNEWCDDGEPDWKARALAAEAAMAANPLPDVNGLVEALELPECAAGCEGLCEQKYVAEPDVHACCVVRRLHRVLAAFQSRKEESRS